VSRPSSAAPPITREDVLLRTRDVLHRGRSRNPDVLLVDAPAGAVVVKDFAPRGRVVRALLGPWLIEREIRAYERLDGHPAVPRLLGRVDALAFAVEYRPGRRMSRRLAGEIPGFVDRLAAAVRAMHERGVVHLDLRHRSNVLVDANGDPVLIDFASSLLLPARGRLGTALVAAFGRFDWRAVEKWRQRIEPASTGAGSTSASSGERRGASRPT
jgi:hypothetical protein